MFFASWYPDSTLFGQGETVSHVSMINLFSFVTHLLNGREALHTRICTKCWSQTLRKILEELEKCLRVVAMHPLPHPLRCCSILWLQILPS